jgi:hypothetical protein
MSPVFFFFRRGVEEKSDEAKSPQKSNEEISASRFSTTFFVCRATREIRSFFGRQKNN